MTQLTPPDRLRCQADKPNGCNAFTLGGRPELVRCRNRPAWIATEKRPGPDGLTGSMSLCEECKEALLKQMGDDFCTFEPVHTLYETGDPDAPNSIKDRNGEVVLGLCKVCGRGEIELSEPCAPRGEGS